MSKKEKEKQLSRDELNFQSRPLPELPGDPIIVRRGEHNISRRQIDPDALKVLYRLHRAGYLAFLVGGGVRDLLLGRRPKDFDISTDARPEEIRKLFRNSRLIGRRFKLVHVFFTGNKIIEVSTFRDSQPIDKDADVDQTVMLAGDNNYGNPETDAVRRDITINGLFYDISSYSIIDYVGGLEDLSQGIIRVIGDPEIRFREDPIRIIRAVRHAGRTGFDIEKNTYEKIISLAQIVRLCPSARIIEELLKDLRGGYSCPILMLLYQTGVLHYLLPFVVVELEAGGGNLEKLKESLIKIDEYIRAGLELPASVIFLSLLIGKSQNVFKSSPEFESLKIFFKAAPRHTIIDSSNELHGDKIGKVSIVEEAEIDAEHIKAELEKLIERTFKSAGVYRRDRELMVKLLKTRLELIENFASAAEVPTVPKSSSFREAVILLDLTAHDELSNSAAQYWTRYLTANPKRVEVERTKSRKPRRRKAR